MRYPVGREDMWASRGTCIHSLEVHVTKSGTVWDGVLDKTDC